MTTLVPDPIAGHPERQKLRRIIPGHYQVKLDAERYGVISHEEDGWHADVRRSGSTETIRFAGIWDTLREAAEELGSL